MAKHGSRWTAVDVCTLYKLMLREGYDSEVAGQHLGRTNLAVRMKLQKGGFLDDDEKPTYIPTALQFYRALKKHKQFELPNIHYQYRSGKLSKIFNFKAKFSGGRASVPLNKQHLIPKMSKREALDKHQGSDWWWRFSNECQANPYMRSHLFGSQEKQCALCNIPVTEADFQAHHISYDHVCSFPGKLYSSRSILGRKSVPDCEACRADNLNRFEGCASRLCAVHGACNKSLSVSED